ncbi:MAG: complex I subunit 5 family protein [Rehaibacterium terrae]|uniref:complex I subunit 5 family protein n=1 Tax=Rehaibacterium terrae TaxID=1341696 RepID=UPI003919F89A
MSPLLALALFSAPLAALALLRPRWRLPALVSAPLPLLALGIVGEGEGRIALLLLGAGFLVDEVNRPLLLLAGIGWSLAGAFVGAAADTRPRVFAGFWLVTLAGQALALLAADMVGFYLGYVIMTLGIYGLVIHARTREAWRAGRVYLALAFAGEAAVLSGLLLLGAAHGNADFATLTLWLGESGGVAAWLLFFGFALKLGLVPLHVWLPLAHPVAPVPASAVLSGVLVKIGLLGMLRFAPPLSLTVGEGLFVLGFFTAAYAALVGLTQSRLKTVLAYSTISQMGLAMAGFAAVQVGSGSAALGALGLFVLHHGLNKVALFLAAGHRLDGWLARALFVLPAASLIGLPFTSGALAKSALKEAAAGWDLAFGLSSLLSTILLLHAWRLARAQRSGRARPHPAWLGAVIAGLLIPWWFGSASMPLAALSSAGLWPALLAVAIVLVLRGRVPALRIPEGDLLAPLERAAAAVVKTVTGSGRDRRQSRIPSIDWRSVGEALCRTDAMLARLPVAGIGLLLALLGLWALLP